MGTFWRSQRVLLFYISIYNIIQDNVHSPASEIKMLKDFSEPHSIEDNEWILCKKQLKSGEKVA